jgi:ATP-dependent exoDNAse (exonuclease V) alpha subunit
MAIYHLSAKVMSRSTGRSIVAAAAYRSGTCLVEEKTGKVHDYSRKAVEHTEILAPAGSPDWIYDRQTLWNRVEAIEKRKDAQLAREVEIALPRELTPEARLDLLRQFVREEFISRGMVADIGVHCPKARDGGEAPHAHVLLTLRPIEGEGFGQKAREWNDRQLLESWRGRWADAANHALERAAKEERIDHRSYAARGINREPEPKLGMTHQLMQKAGLALDRLNQWQATRFRNRAKEHLASMPKPGTANFYDLTEKLSHLYDEFLRDRGRTLSRQQQREIGYER